jgi:hypothetical protein
VVLSFLPLNPQLQLQWPVLIPKPYTTHYFAQFILISRSQRTLTNGPKMPKKPSTHLTHLNHPLTQIPPSINLPTIPYHPLNPPTHFTLILNNPPLTQPLTGSPVILNRKCSMLRNTLRDPEIPRGGIGKGTSLENSSE